MRVHPEMVPPLAGCDVLADVSAQSLAFLELVKPGIHLWGVCFSRQELPISGLDTGRI